MKTTTVGSLPASSSIEDVAFAHALTVTLKRSLAYAPGLHRGTYGVLQLLAASGNRDSAPDTSLLFVLLQLILS